MDEVTARRRLESMTAPDKAPLLTDPELDDLVALAKRPDHDGRLPTDAAWVETWDLNAAATVGWGWKAGKASGDFDFTDGGGGSYSREQVYEMCKRQEATYRAKCHGWIPLARYELPWESSVL